MKLPRLTVLIAVGASALMSCYASECAKSVPTATAESFYEKHRDFIHQGAKSPPLSPSLAKLVAANITQNLDAGDAGAIDWNFWVDAQDGDVEGVAKAISSREEHDRVIVRLSYLFFLSPANKPTPKVSDVVLTRAGNGCWLVDDVLHDGRSVRKLLQIETLPKKSR